MNENSDEALTSEGTVSPSQDDVVTPDTDTDRLTRLEIAARTYAAAEMSARLAKEAMEEARDEIDRLFPPQAGTVSIPAGNVLVQIKRNESYDWDKRALAEHFRETGEALPDHVNKTFTVDRRKYDRLTTSEREELEPYLTKKLTASKISITPL